MVGIDGIKAIPLSEIETEIAKLIGSMVDDKILCNIEKLEFKLNSVDLSLTLSGDLMSILSSNDSHEEIKF